MQDGGYEGEERWSFSGCVVSIKKSSCVTCACGSGSSWVHSLFCLTIITFSEWVNICSTNVQKLRTSAYWLTCLECLYLSNLYNITSLAILFYGTLPRTSILMINKPGPVGNLFWCQCILYGRKFWRIAEFTLVFNQVLAIIIFIAKWLIEGARNLAGPWVS